MTRSIFILFVFISVYCKGQSNTCLDVNYGPYAPLGTPREDSLEVTVKNTCDQDIEVAVYFQVYDKYNNNAIKWSSQLNTVGSHQQYSFNNSFTNGKYKLLSRIKGSNVRFPRNEEIPLSDVDN